MSKKILLLSSVIFLSSCATTNISELGDKFLDLINPSDDATEVAMLSGEETLVAMDQTGGFTIDELEALSNDELIAIAKEKGLEDLILLDEDGNLLNRDQIINAIVESAELLESKSDELETMSDDELIEIAVAKGLGEEIVLDADGNLANRDEIIESLLEDAAAAASSNRDSMISSLLAKLPSASRTISSPNPLATAISISSSSDIVSSSSDLLSRSSALSTMALII